MSANRDDATIAGFGAEWSAFDQSGLDVDEAAELFARYFNLVDLDALAPASVVADIGCGSGRWARFVAPRVARLYAIDASPDALEVARRNLAEFTNVTYHVASVDDLPLEDASCDLIYSLGVLHHLPDTPAAIASLVPKLRPGGRLLVYLYYRFDDRPAWFRAIWQVSDTARRGIARLPFRIRRVVTDVIAAVIYWPLARTSRVLERRGLRVGNIPLAYYRNSSWYTMRTDALDRFGTRLEQRFTRPEIESMLAAAGLEEIEFRTSEPFWCAIGRRSTAAAGSAP